MNHNRSRKAESRKAEKKGERRKNTNKKGRRNYEHNMEMLDMRMCIVKSHSHDTIHV